MYFKMLWDAILATVLVLTTTVAVTMACIGIIIGGAIMLTALISKE